MHDPHGKAHRVIFEKSVVCAARRTLKLEKVSGFFEATIKFK